MSLRGDLEGLSKELQLAGVAAVALAASLLLPWYQKSFFVRGVVVEDNLSAFGVFSFIEAAERLVREAHARAREAAGEPGPGMGSAEDR